MTIDSFKQRIVTHLLPEFCNDPSRNFRLEGFKTDWNNVAEVDAIDFLRGLDAKLVRHVGRGQYVAPRSAAKEQFFWEGSRRITPRPITLWLEPIITVAGITRLHFDFGWPISLIGAQTNDWAFDFAAYSEADTGTEHIACEVKKSVIELNTLISDMKQLATGSVVSEVGLTKHQINAFRKLVALRKRKVPFFWALGPGRVSYFFKMSYTQDATAIFIPCDEYAFAYQRGIV